LIIRVFLKRSTGDALHACEWPGFTVVDGGLQDEVETRSDKGLRDA
jgi:hypothetical protein